MWRSNDEQFEIWKGLALIALSINHLVLWPLSDLAFLMKLTYQSVGWCTFASLYFAIAGVQWGRRAGKSQDFWNWNIRRAKRLMLWVFLFTLLFCTGVRFGWWVPAPWQRHIDWRQVSTPLLALLGVRLPWLVDVVWLHFFLGLFAALVWRCPGLRNNYLAILITSFCLWIISQFDLLEFDYLQREAPSWHTWTSWQFLFIASAVSQQDDFKPRVPTFFRSFKTQLLIFAAATLFIMKTQTNISKIQILTSAQNFAPLFAINSLVLISFLPLTEKARFPTFIKTLGRYSLRGYGVQCVVVYILGNSNFIGKHVILFEFSLLLLSLSVIILCSGIGKGWRPR